MGRGTMAGPMRRAAVTDTATEAPKNAWSQARTMDLQFPPPLPPSPDPPHVPWCSGARGDDTFKDGPWASARQQTTQKEQQSRELALWALDCLRRGLLTRYTEVNPTQPQQQLAWLQQAPQDRALSGSAGKRRTPVWWIPLASSSEEIKRKGARWAAMHLDLH